MTAIVTVNVSQTIAPAPSKLQKTGALISQGGTNTSPGTSTLLTELLDLDAIIKEEAAISTIAGFITTQIATVTTTQVHGLPIGDAITVIIADVVGSLIPAGYNGTFVATITGASTFTYVPATGSGSADASVATWINQSSPELTSMATTFFDQGASQSVYVLELGPGNPAQGVDFLTTWIAANAGTYYSYLVPRSWDSIPTFLALLTQLNSTTSKTYMFTTTTLSTYGNYSALQKSCFPLVEAPVTGVWAANALTGLSFAAGWGTNTLTALSWAATNGGTATATTTTPHSVIPGNTFSLTGNTPAGYNGTFVALPGTTASTIKYALAVDPGAETVLGSLVADPGGTATATTTSAHGVAVGQYFAIAGSTADTIANGYNGTFKAAPGTAGSTLKYTLAANPGTESVLGRLVASLYASTGAPSTEFSAAAPFYVTLNYSPSTTNKVTPTAFSFLFGVTPFPTQGNGATLQALENAFTNVVGTGAAGGISDAMLFWGTTRDGRDFTYWYSVDWVQITSALDLTNAVMNGSNNRVNPLYYNQAGINRLQQVLARTLSNGLTFGLVLGAVTQTQLDGPELDAELDAGTFDNQTVVNAVPFVPYSAENPSDYAIGQYDGLAAVYTPARGFLHIVFNVNVTDFVTQ